MLPAALFALLGNVQIDKPLLTLPLMKGGESYAMIDFYSSDIQHIQASAEQFCSDHGFSPNEKQMIIDHATKEFARMASTSLAELPDVNGVSASSSVKPSVSELLHKFMLDNRLSAADVLHALAAQMD